MVFSGRLRTYAAYILLRRNIWRSVQPHYMGLHKLYLEDRLLCCSLERKSVAEILQITEPEVSRILTSLEKDGIVERRRTGRQSIYVLGKWLDVKGDGSYKGAEWFFIDGVFGVSEQDFENTLDGDDPSANQQEIATEKTSENGESRLMWGKTTHQKLAKSASQMWGKSAHNNIKGNRDENTVNGFAISPIRQLADLDQPIEKSKYLAHELGDQLGDGTKSGRFYKSERYLVMDATTPNPSLTLVLVGGEDGSKTSRCL